MEKDKRHCLLFRTPKGELEEGSMSEEVFKKHKSKCFRFDKQKGRWIVEGEFTRLPEDSYYRYEETCRGCGNKCYH